eukprot:maker-scaffold_14-snap-gene-11.52-mRNA-1 protein AED:0.17 eAED:0.97 QI:0/0/0/0.66/0/0.33/3/0/302
MSDSNPDTIQPDEEVTPFPFDIPFGASPTEFILLSSMLFTLLCLTCIFLYCIQRSRNPNNLRKRNAAGFYSYKHDSMSKTKQVTKAARSVQRSKHERAPRSLLLSPTSTSSPPILPPRNLSPKSLAGTKSMVLSTSANSNPPVENLVNMRTVTHEGLDLIPEPRKDKVYDELTVDFNKKNIQRGETRRIFKTKSRRGKTEFEQDRVLGELDIEESEEGEEKDFDLENNEEMKEALEKFKSFIEDDEMFTPSPEWQKKERRDSGSEPHDSLKSAGPCITKKDDDELSFQQLVNSTLFITDIEL